MRRRILLLITLVALAVAASGETVAIVGVNIVPMDTERVLLGQTVIVRDGVIESIGPRETIPVPIEARVVYGRARWLVPGLTDMHVHIRSADLPRYVENGITSVRDLAGTDSVLALAAAVARGERLGPRIFTSSKLLNGPGQVNPEFSVIVREAADAQRVVDAQLARGCRSIKLYEELSEPVYDALVIAAHARGVKVAGHVTRNVAVTHAMVMQDSIEHLAGYEAAVGGWADANRSLMPQLAAASRDAAVWNCPTLDVYTNWVTLGMAADVRARILAARRAFVTALDEAGARILAGSDSGFLVDAGTSLHDELGELLDAGLTPFETLSAATRLPAEYLGEHIGVIEPGARGDLLLVAENPLEHMATLRRPAGVMVNGAWLSYERRRAVRH
jgi:imidazolonepropionase-like amidohydrolase